MALKVFPTARFSFGGFEADIDARTIEGGASLSGITDVVATDGGGRWYCEASEPYLDEPELALAWDALSSNLNAGQPIIMPLTDARSNMMGTVTVPPGGLPWWEESDFGTPDTGVTLADDAALRATTLTLTVTFVPQPIRYGQRFSIDHETLRHRAYKVAEVVSDDGEEVVIRIDPPLREATDADTMVDFVDPKCVMRVEGGMRSPRTMGFADSSVRFVEHFATSYA